MTYVNLGCGTRFHRDWTNFDIVSYDPAVIAADLSYSNNGCSAQFKVAALFPSTSCSKVDAMGAPTGEPDATVCANAVFKGYAVTCDPALLMCVLAKAPPSLLE